MKSLLQILIFTIPFIFYGQKWSLLEIDDSREYAYHYIFSIDHLDDKNVYTIAQIDNKETTSIKIMYKNGEPVLNVLSIKNTKTKEVQKFLTDDNGKINVALNLGFYELEFRDPFYDDLDMQFRVEKDSQLDIVIYLGRAPEVEVYDIKSKIELEETEIFKIIDCVKINPENFYESCSDLNRFKIFMQL